MPPQHSRRSRPHRTTDHAARPGIDDRCRPTPRRNQHENSPITTAGGLVAALAALSLTLAACAGSSDCRQRRRFQRAGSAAAETGTLKLWHYESANSAMGIAWDEAIEIFKTEHPGVTVEFERKAFEQIQQNAGMILSSDEGPDIMEYNKGNATAGLLATQGLLTDLTDRGHRSAAGTRSSARACRPPPSTTRRASWAPATGTACRTTAST